MTKTQNTSSSTDPRFLVADGENARAYKIVKIVTPGHVNAFTVAQFTTAGVNGKSADDTAIGNLLDYTERHDGVYELWALHPDGVVGNKLASAQGGIGADWAARAHVNLRDRDAQQFDPLDASVSAPVPNIVTVTYAGRTGKLSGDARSGKDGVEVRVDWDDGGFRYVTAGELAAMVVGMTDRAVYLDNGTANLIVSALSAATFDKSQHEPGVGPYDYAEALARLAAQFGGPAGNTAAAQVAELDAGIEPERVFIQLTKTLARQQ